METEFVPSLYVVSVARWSSVRNYWVMAYQKTIRDGLAQTLRYVRQEEKELARDFEGDKLKIVVASAMGIVHTSFVG